MKPKKVTATAMLLVFAMVFTMVVSITTKNLPNYFKIVQSNLFYANLDILTK